MNSSFWSTSKQRIMSGRCTEVQESEWCKQIGSGWSKLTRIVTGVQQQRRCIEQDSKQPGGGEVEERGEG
jgi:hypothetical protein